MDLCLEGHHAEEWGIFVGKLFSSYVKLVEDKEDMLCQYKDPATNNFNIKLGYKAQVEATFQGDKLWVESFEENACSSKGQYSFMVDA